MTVKKFFITVAALLLAASLMASCSAKQNEGDKDDTKPSVTTERKGFEDVTAPPEQETSAETTADEGSDSAGFTTTDAVAAARAWMGDADEETGFLYSYSFDEMITEDGKEYYKIRVSWYIEEEDRYSLCCYLLVGEDGSVRNYNW